MFAKKHSVMKEEESFNFARPEGQLAVDVIETPDKVIIRSAIAGVFEDDLHITINEDMVTIRGERTIATLPMNATVHYEECFWGAFSRSIILPCRITPDDADASLQNGILTITLNKARGDIRVPVRKDLSL
ncbi:MAG: Hsp20/alpha crystallin family protein [Patescibacteria group bacterium]|jgi:HSP20 family protein